MSIWTDFQGGGVKETYHRVGGIRTRVIEAGEGDQPLFLLHGTGGHAEAFCRNVVPLSQDRRIMAPDLVGHGFSDHPDVEYDLDVYADHLLALADAVGVEKVDVTGGSQRAQHASTRLRPSCSLAAASNPQMFESANVKRA